MQTESQNPMSGLQIANPGNLSQPAQPNTLQASPSGGANGGAMGSPTDGSGGKGAMTAPQQQTVPDGLLAVRKTLNDRNIDDSRIGWNEATGMVTIDGVDAFKPNVNIDGTTYADENALSAMTFGAYNNAGDPLQAARTYAADQLDASLVQWDGASGVVNIAGTPIKPAYVSSDGIAYVPKSQLDAAIAAYRTQNGTITPQDVYKQNNDKYEQRSSDALNALLNRGEFKYNPDDDPVYASYRKQYERNAEDALRRVLNDNNTSLTGASGAVLSEALAAYNTYMDKMSDKVPELAQQAYSRYQGETQRLRDNFTDVYKASDNDYDRRRQLDETLYGRAQDAIKNINDYEKNQFYENQTQCGS